MLKSITLRCRPGAQFHFGKIALDDNASLDDTSPILHSDSLASAIVDLGFRALNSPVALQVLSDFESGKVRVSSLFWLLELPGGHAVQFLPKPVSFDAILAAQQPNNQAHRLDRKHILRARFISKGVWEAGLRPDEWPDQCIVIQREFVLTRQEANGLSETTLKKIRLYHSVTLPKVAVHKLTREDSLYNQTNIQIANPANYGLPGASVHFYFLLESKDAAAFDRAYKLACILVDEGIGGERSVGCGELAGIEAPVSFQLTPAQHTKGLFCTASLVSPANQDELDNCRAQKIITRAGRQTTSDGPLMRLKMIAEGAILKTKIGGKTHQISMPAAQHEYKRFGTAICLPAHDHHEPATFPAP